MDRATERAILEIIRSYMNARNARVVTGTIHDLDFNDRVNAYAAALFKSFPAVTDEEWIAYTELVYSYASQIRAGQRQSLEINANAKDHGTVQVDIPADRLPDANRGML